MGPFLKGWEKAQSNCVTAVEKGPWGPGQNQTLDSLDRNKLAKKSNISAPEKCLWGQCLKFSVVPRLIPTYLTIPEEAFPIDVSLGFTYFW